MKYSCESNLPSFVYLKTSEKLLFIAFIRILIIIPQDFRKNCLCNLSQVLKSDGLDQTYFFLKKIDPTPKRLLEIPIFKSTTC